MKSISLCMIVKNEEDVIDRCLSSIFKAVDEIIIVDTGSTDKTKEICKNYTDKIFDFKWCDDFSKARNFSFSLATCEYIMWLDADDVVPKNTLNEIIKLKNDMCADVYMLKYDIAFCNNQPTFSFYRERILKNNSNATWQGAVHECITPYGKVVSLPISIEHRKIKHTQSNRNYLIYKKVLKSRELSPREQYYYGRELFDHKKYNECIKVLRKFINSKLGWTENNIDACYLLSQCFNYLSDRKNELKYLFKTFEYDTPRANICCKIGDYYLNENKYNLSISWYLLSIKCEDVTNKGGFVENIYYNYYPYLQLCVCFYKLGDLKTAEFYNNKARKYLITETTENNKNFFNQFKK